MVMALFKNEGEIVLDIMMWFIYFCAMVLIGAVPSLLLLPVLLGITGLGSEDVRWYHSVPIMFIVGVITNKIIGVI